MNNKARSLEMYLQGSNTREIAAELGITVRSVQRHLAGSRDAKAFDKSAMAGAPDPAHNVPVGHRVRGVSTLVDADGNARMRWVKSAQEVPDPVEVLAALRDEVDSWGERFLQTAPAEPPKPSSINRDLLAVYPMGDPHLGMLAWREESGADFDLQIAESNLVAATRDLARLAPRAERAAIIQLGDFFHANDQSNRTPQSGHQLDADGRHAKVMRVGIRTMVSCVDAALERHQHVDVYCLRGNHDPDMAVALSLMLEYAYRNEPRVHVCASPSHYRALEHGECMIGMTHGDGAKPGDVPLLFATDFWEMWGRTQFRHVYSGHVHHEAVKEYPGMTIETVRSLAGKDAWHAMRGYRSGRSMFVDVWHRGRGPIMRHRVGVESLAPVKTPC